MLARATITQTFAHKTVFLTGATGFVGKAIIEKLLCSVPTIEKIYVLIRPRETHSAAARLASDILRSLLFDRLRSEHADADAYFAAKLHALVGDVTSPMLGLSPSDLALLQQRVQITIHSAAAVKFNEPLAHVVRVNCNGALHMLDVVHSCPLVECHLHVSTAYVNGNRFDGDATAVRETLYPLEFDVDEAVAAIATATPDEVPALQHKYQGTYANTYGLAKSMAEHLVVQNARKTLPLVILRPTVIGATWQAPVPGFIEQIAGVAGLYLAVGMGVLSLMVGDEKKIVDLVPLDLVVHTALASVAFAISERETTAQPWPFIVHSGTSAPRENPVDFERPNRAMLAYFQAHPPTKGISKPQLTVYASPARFRVAWFVKYQIRLRVLTSVAALSRNARLKKQAADLRKLTHRAQTIVDVFRPFTHHQWVFCSDAVTTVRERFASERDEWWLEASEIDWDRWTVALCRGIKQHQLQETDAGVATPTHARGSRPATSCA